MLYRLEDFSKTRKRESGRREVKSEVLVKIRPAHASCSQLLGDLCE